MKIIYYYLFKTAQEESVKFKTEADAVGDSPSKFLAALDAGILGNVFEGGELAPVAVVTEFPVGIE